MNKEKRTHDIKDLQSVYDNTRIYSPRLKRLLLHTHTEMNETDDKVMNVIRQRKHFHHQGKRGRKEGSK